MNCSVYILGADSDGVMHAYPNDYAVHDVFERFTPFLKKDSLFAVHRNGSLFYHVWYRKTSEGYFGICALLNGVWFLRTDILIGVFENAFSLAAVDGKLLRVDNDGHVRTTASAFAQNKTDINKIDQFIKDKISSYSKFCVNIPPQNASTDPHAIQVLQHGASPHLFGIALETYRSVCATYGNGDGNVNALLQRIEDMTKERDDYSNKCKQLEEQCKSIEKSKNRYVTVVFLTGLMLIGSIVAIGVISNKNREIERQLATIQNNEETISSQGDTISKQKRTINEHLQTISSLNNKVDKLESKYNSLETDYSSITSTYPFKITNIEIGNVYYDRSIETNFGNTLYSSRTMYLTPKIYYYGYSAGSHEIKIKWYTPSGEIRRGTGSPTGYSQSENVYFYTGSNVATLTGWGNSTKGQWASGTYRIEVWYNNMCLKSKTFTIY